MIREDWFLIMSTGAVWMDLIHYVIKAAGSPPDLRISPDPFFRKIMVFSAAAVPPCLSNQTARRERESSRSLGWQMILIVSLRFLLWYITSGKRTEICAPFHLSTAKQACARRRLLSKQKRPHLSAIASPPGCQEQKSIRNQLNIIASFLSPAHQRLSIVKDCESFSLRDFLKSRNPGLTLQGHKGLIWHRLVNSLLIKPPKHFSQKHQQHQQHSNNEGISTQRHHYSLRRFRGS